MTDSHNDEATNHGTHSHADGVRSEKLGIPEIEAKQFDQDTFASGLAVNEPLEDGPSFTAEMLKIMLADCRSDLEKTEAELRQIEPVRAFLVEKERRLHILEEGILALMRHCRPDLAIKYAGKTAAGLGRKTHDRAAQASVGCLLMARNRAFPERG
ncbi:hypothetical protein [Acetobacter pasteurianus]|uniref:Uncharacterized protein n=1 Tax=Acetobacter pasteurianus NBRC 3188 TaxID=1226663 RepID=A0A401WUI2_ACEPA|nr:hypothetical protein [Acetobacter pasteurianus]GCD53001.1 hypothetical protein NBRC3188_1698 [Acetobacter pasteurianus NBRC 3188]